VGGLAVGTISFGGLAIGGLSLAGLSLGLVAIGGLAVGFLALGGAAVGWVAAVGGLAVAREFALGGAAIAEHANDEAAREFFQQAPAGIALGLVRHTRWLTLLVLFPIIVGLRSLQEDRSASRNRTI
jgi:hypothetical protein